MPNHCKFKIKGVGSLRNIIRYTSQLIKLPPTLPLKIKWVIIPVQEGKFHLIS